MFKFILSISVVALVAIVTACSPDSPGSLAITVAPSPTPAGSPLPVVTTEPDDPTATPAPEAAATPTGSLPTPAALPTGSSAPPLEIQKDQPFMLMIGQAANLAGEDLSITFETVLEDSRCPTQVTCVWAGQAIISLAVRQADQTALLELNSNPSMEQNVASFGGQFIHFIALDPYPEHPDRPIPLEDYEATLMVTEE